MNETKIDVYGRVQGIGFRRTIKHIAEELNLKGVIKNNEDGSVTILANGEKQNLDKFIKVLKQNPGFSKIDELELKESDKIQERKEFSIKKDKNFINDQKDSFLNLGKYFLKKDKLNIPKHIAVIPDGNRRWAKLRGQAANFGHYQSANYENLKSLFNEAKNLGVKYFSIWGFSTENWKRNDNEIKNIFDLVSDFVDKYKQDLHKDKIRFRHIGRKERLPKKLSKKLIDLEKQTKNYNEFNVQLYLDYGGRDELLRAINKLLKSKTKKINEEEFKKYLDTNSIPDPDLIIRTSGEYRLSGFMPFQSTYSELYFTDKHFPDFNTAELRKAIQEFSKRKRRFGGDVFK